MRALVTGAAGFVGKFLIEHLLACGDTVIASDHNLPAEHERVKSAVNWINLNICDPNSVQQTIKQHEPDIIYHLAGIAFVPEAEDNFDRALLVNVGGTANILRACHLLQTGSTVLVISSAEVYGRIKPSDLPIREGTALKPANNYSLSKCMAELVCTRYEQFGFVRTIIARPFNHIGPGQNERFVVSSFCKQLADIKAGRAAPVIRVGNLAARRDFSDVRDIVRGYRMAALKGRGVYNFGSGRAVAVQSVLDKLIEISGLKVTVEQDPSRMRAVEVPEVYGSYALAEQELGWRPEIDLEQSLRDVFNWAISVR